MNGQSVVLLRSKGLRLMAIVDEGAAALVVETLKLHDEGGHFTFETVKAVTPDRLLSVVREAQDA